MIRVLLVDDHQLVRTGVRHILEEAMDIEIVAEASSGEEAVRLAKRHHPDVVLMDVRMPGIGGIEATRRVKRMLPETGILAVTAVQGEPFPSRLREAGASGYITKGSTAGEILEAVRRVASGGVYISGDAVGHSGRTPWREGGENPFLELAPREMQVIELLLQGKKNQEISDILNISPKTVSTHRQRAFEKLDVHSDVELTRLAFRYGILTDEN